jgi:hypothetical protein
VISQPPPLPDPAEVDLDQSDVVLTVAVGTKSTRKGRTIDLASAAETVLRGQIRTLLAELSRKKPVAYFPGNEIGEDEYLALPHALLDPKGPVYEVLAPPRAFDPIAAGDIPRVSVPYWFLQTQHTQTGMRASFIRKGGVRKALRRGSRLYIFGDTLRYVQQPALTLDDTFDVVVTHNGVMAVRPGVLEKLFYDTPALLAKIPQWVQQLHTQLPLHGNGAALLEAKCATDWRLRRRLLGLCQSPHIANLTVPGFVAAVNASGLDPVTLIAGGQLHFDTGHPFRLMKFLNDEAAVGRFTGEAMQFSGRAPF